MQNLLFPINLRPVELLTGVFVAINRMFNVKVSFNLSKKLWFLYYRLFFITSIAEMDYYKKREISSITNINSKGDLESFSSLLTDHYVEHCLKVIYLLTKFNDPYTLMENTKCDIEELPELVYNIVKHINSTKFVKRVEGTDKSVLRFVSQEIKFTSFEDITADTKDIQLLSLMLELNSTAKLIGIPTVKVDTLNCLFSVPDDFMNVSVYQLEEDGNFKLNYGDKYDKSCLRFFALFQPKYEFDDNSIYINSTQTVSRKNIYDEISNPECEKLFRKSVNYLDYTLTDTLFNDESLGKINMEVKYKGMLGDNQPTEPKSPKVKGFGLDPIIPTKQIRSKADKVKDLLDRELGDAKIDEEKAKVDKKDQEDNTSKAKDKK